jgi:hypothetical protein
MVGVLLKFIDALRFELELDINNGHFTWISSCVSLSWNEWVGNLQAASVTAVTLSLRWHGEPQPAAQSREESCAMTSTPPDTSPIKHSFFSGNSDFTGQFAKVKFRRRSKIVTMWECYIWQLLYLGRFMFYWFIFEKRSFEYCLCLDVRAGVAGSNLRALLLSSRRLFSEIL